MMSLAAAELHQIETRYLQAVSRFGEAMTIKISTRTSTVSLPWNLSGVYIASLAKKMGVSKGRKCPEYH